MSLVSVKDTNLTWPWDHASSQDTIFDEDSK
jgi:hypothetical protein